MPRLAELFRATLRVSVAAAVALGCRVSPLPPAESASLPNTTLQAESASHETIFRQVRLFDGQDVHRSVDVLVFAGRVARVAAHIEPPSGAAIVEGQGRTLLPGLIDAHVHTWPEAAQSALQFGVTTELDMFMDTRMASSLREEQRAGHAAGRADVFSAGTLVTAPGGHGTEYGPKISTLQSAESAAAFVDARLAEGSDWIKIVYDDGHMAGVSLGVLSEATLRATIAATRARGKLSVVHVSTLGEARTAIEAGASGLAHLFTDSSGNAVFAALMRQRGAFAIPTLTVLSVITNTGAGVRLAQDARLAPYLSRQDRMLLSQSVPVRPNAPVRRYAVAESTIRVLRAAGVPLLAGTDAGNPGTLHGASLHLELELLVAAGLTPVEVLRAATSVPARIFSLADRGKVVPGARADLLLVDGDPTVDITSTRAILGVWKAGVLADRSTYQRSVAATLQGPPPPPGLSDGWISRFDGGSLSAAFGSGWSSTSDAAMGGNSNASLRVVDGALEVDGIIGSNSPHGWAGAMFSPGATPFAAADLSSKQEIVFRARGDGKSLQILAFAESRGRVPMSAKVALSAQWQEFAIPFRSLGGMDGRDVQALIFAAGPSIGPFHFAIDDVRVR